MREIAAILRIGGSVFALVAFACAHDRASSSGAPSVAETEFDDARAGHPDEATQRDADALIASLSPWELAYLERLDWERTTGSQFFHDPVFRKMMRVVLPLLPAASTTSTATLHVKGDGTSSDCVSAEAAVTRAVTKILARIATNKALTLVAAGTCFGALETGGALAAACLAAAAALAGSEAGDILSAALPFGEGACGAELPADLAVYCTTLSDFGASLPPECTTPDASPIGETGDAGGDAGTCGLSCIPSQHCVVCPVQSPTVTACSPSGYSVGPPVPQCVTLDEECCRSVVLCSKTQYCVPAPSTVTKTCPLATTCCFNTPTGDGNCY